MSAAVCTNVCAHCGHTWSSDYAWHGPCPACARNDPLPKTPGVNPLCIIEKDNTVTLDVMAERVRKTREQHGKVLQDFAEVWYNAPHTWHFTQFLGVGMMKSPNDLWAYHDIMWMYRPNVVIETGTYQGGSALWFAFLMDMLQIEGGHIWTVDYEDNRRCDHPRITFCGGNSVDADLVLAVESDAFSDEMNAARGSEPPRVLVVLDSDHSEEHVYRELELYAPFAHQVGDWLVVEDTNVSWPGQTHYFVEVVGEPPEGPFTYAQGMARWEELGKALAPKGIRPAITTETKGADRGAQGALIRYLSQHEGEFVQDILSERWLCTMNPGGWLRRVAPCTHR